MAKKKKKTSRGPSLKSQVRRTALDAIDTAVYACLGTASVLAINEGSEGSGTIVQAIKSGSSANVSAAIKDSAQNAPKNKMTYAAPVGIRAYDGVMRLIRKVTRFR